MFRRGVVYAACLFAAAVVSFPVRAQEGSQWRDEMEVLRADIRADRQAVVAEAMALTEAEGKAFWPLYNEFRFETGKIGDQAAALIEDYAKHYGELTDEKAAELLDRMLTLKQKKLDLQRKYVKKFKKVLSPKRVAQYYQIENKLDAVIDFEVAAAIPLAQ